MVIVLIFCLASCGDRTTVSQSSAKINPPAGKNLPKIAEVSPPQTIQELRQVLESYQPQVKILSPGPNEILEDNTATVKFQVEDLPIFKNAQLGLGPHLHVFLDNRPYIAVYDLNEPLIFKDLEPGTHTLRVFASRPWHESFKNQGAYAQITFHIFTKTDDNNPNLQEPLLTYSRPQGSYGAEPIMLDFYLANAPVQPNSENPGNEISDWQIRCTIDGTTFIIEDWQPIYLTGFKPGKNWVQLELIDKQGNPVKNVYNNTVRLITYEPNGSDTLSKLVRGELSVADTRGIVDPNYTPPPPPEPIVIETPVPQVIEQPETTPAEIAPAEPNTSATPAPDEKPVTEKVEEQPKTDQSSAPSQQGIEVTKPLQNPQPAGFYNRVISPEATQKSTPTQEIEKRKLGGFFNRYRRADETKLPIIVAPTKTQTSEPVVPSLSVPQPEVISEPTSEVVKNPTDVEVTPLLPEIIEKTTPEPTTIEAIPPLETKAEGKVEEAGSAAEVETSSEITPSEITPPEISVTSVEVAPEPNVESIKPNREELGELTETDSQVKNSDVVEETSSSNLSTDTPTSKTVVPPGTVTQPKTQADAKIEPSKAAPALSKTKPNNVFSKFFDRFRRSPASEVTLPPSLPPTLPEIINTPTPEITTPESVVTSDTLTPDITTPESVVTSDTPTPEITTPESVITSDTLTPEITTPESVVTSDTPTPELATPSETSSLSETSASDASPAIVVPTTEPEVINLDVEVDQSEQIAPKSSEAVEPTEPSEAPGVRKEA